jgi:uncharacterized protein YegL
MFGEPIEAVKDGVQKLLSSLRRDPYALESVWISLITFDRNANVLIPLTELSEFNCHEITLSNEIKRNIGLGLQLLCEQYDKEIKKTTPEQKGDWLPIAVLMTSGDPSDAKRFETVISQFRDYVFAKKIVCVTGMKGKIKILNHLTHDIYSLDTMNSHTFSKFWQWVSTLVGIQSRSIDQQQEESLPSPPQDLNLFYPESNIVTSEVMPKSFSSPVNPSKNPNKKDQFHFMESIFMRTFRIIGGLLGLFYGAMIGAAISFIRESNKDIISNSIDTWDLLVMFVVPIFIGGFIGLFIGGFICKFIGKLIGRLLDQFLDLFILSFWRKIKR